MTKHAKKKFKQNRVLRDWARRWLSYPGNAELAERAILEGARKWTPKLTPAQEVIFMTNEPVILTAGRGRLAAYYDTILAGQGCNCGKPRDLGHFNCAGVYRFPVEEKENKSVDGIKQT